MLNHPCLRIIARQDRGGRGTPDMMAGNVGGGMGDSDDEVDKNARIIEGDGRLTLDKSGCKGLTTYHHAASDHRGL